MATFLKLVNGRPQGTAMALTDLPSIANVTFLGNISGSAATPSALTATQVTANLNIFTASLQGLVPGSGGGTVNFLRADGTWAAAGGTSPLTTKGDIYTFSTVNARQPVPSDYGALVPDSTQATGWRDASYTQIQQGRPGKNYIQYADFENNSTTGWTLGTIGTLTNGLPTGSPTFGSGASGNLSIAATSSSIEGAFSLNYVSSAATTQGNMVASSSYAIDVEDQAKVLTVKFYYSVPSGVANCNFSGTSSNSFAWALYDVTNSSWLSSAGNFNLIQSSGCGYVTGTCQTNATTANIRLCVYNANATSGAATLTLDGFYVGPQTAPSGPAMGDWNNNLVFTVGGFGTPSNLTTWTRRIGDTLEVQGYFLVGSPAGSTAFIQLPSGYSIDTTKIGSQSNSTLVGIITTAAGGSGNVFANGDAWTLFFDGSTTNQIFYGQTGTTSTSTYAKINGSSVSGTDYHSFNFRIPIAGWSSNSVMSSDTDTRVVAARYTGATATITNSYSNVTFTTESVDTHGAYSGAIYTVPVTGIYDFGGQVYVSGTASLNGTTIIGLSQNSSTVGENDFTYAGAITGSVGIPFNFGSIPCKAGDTIVIQVKSSITLPVITSSSTENFFQSARRSGPAVITATESVNARYYNSSTAISGTPTTVNWSVQDYDTNNAMSSGTYTIPVSGKYQINSSVIIGVSDNGDNLFLEIFKNGTSVSSTLRRLADSANGSSNTVHVGDIIKCNAGDLITIRPSTNGATPTIINGTDNKSNFMSICRVGN